ncbi:MAG TPA: metal ABC transporter permease [Nitrospiria bacterium]|jgi:manganese/iron transport system permease protein/iron/zinc/copper transport system permease protein
MEFLLEPLKYEFFRNGLIAAPMVGAICGLIGVYIVLRGMSYIGHGLSHAAFGGAVIGYVINVNFYIGAGLWGFLAALLINQVVKRNKIGADAAIGVVTTASFAIGVALISKAGRFTRDFEAALFGNILGVTSEDLFVIAGVGLMCFLVLGGMFKQLLFTTFDKESAKVYGVPTEWVDTWFSLILAASIIASMRVIGVTMIAAAIVIPAITARMLTDSFNKMVLLSTGIGSFTAVSGMYLSFYFDAASGATIVLFAATVFCLILFYDFLRKLSVTRVALEGVPLIATHEHSHIHEGKVHFHPHTLIEQEAHHDIETSPEHTHEEGQRHGGHTH